MPNTSLILSLYKIGAIKFGHYTLKSGRSSTVYLDLRQIISYPAILSAVSESIWQKAQDTHFNVICGVPYTALSIATCISLQHNVPMIMRRKEKKSYGTQKQIEGVFESGQHCLIIEDVVTTGGSILETADDIEAVGLNITDVVALIDREQHGKEQLKKRGYMLHTAFTLKEILQILLHSAPLEASEQAIAETFINEQF